MAAFAQASRISTPPPAGRPSSSSSRRPDLSPYARQRQRAIPHGACNFRELALGAAAPVCGCQRFWCNGDAWTGETATASFDGGRGATESLYCHCGHHLCFHSLTEQVEADHARGHATIASSAADALSRSRQGVHTQVLHARTQYRPRSAAGSSFGRRTRNTWDVHERGRDVPMTAENHSRQSGDAALNGEAHTIRDFAAMPDGTTLAPGFNPRTGASETSSGIPSIPSICLLNSDQLRPDFPQHRQTEGQSYYRPSGLGLSMLHNDQDYSRRQHAPAQSAGNNLMTRDAQITDSRQPSTVACSTDGSEHRYPRTSPSRTFMDHIMRVRSQPQPLNVAFPSSRAALLGHEDMIQSATEVATPSASATPDLEGLDQTVQETRNLVDSLVHELASVENGDANGGDTNVPSESQRENTKGSTLLLTNTADNQEETANSNARDIPLALRKLVPQIHALHRHLTSYPNVSDSIRRLTQRIDILENASFSYIAPDELNDKFELMDGRLLDVEHRLRDHETFHAALEDEQSSQNALLWRRPREHESYHESFLSAGSHPSNTSSALISAAIDRAEKNSRMEGIEQRLDDLEAIAIPCDKYPLEIEVVFLPWGRDLKGIWNPLDENEKNGSKSVSQVSEDWTQAWTTRSPSRAPLQITSMGQSGWTSQAIQSWADGTHEMLHPRACGRKSVVYRRLESRGLVRNVTLRNSSSLGIQSAIVAAFGPLLARLTNQEKFEEQQTADVMAAIGTFPGLKAAVVPLRKQHRQPRLEFLLPDEMVTSAIWTAEHLISSIIMRAPGGVRRLYVTHPQGYLQNNNSEDVSWTWQRLRELPRVPSDPQGPHSPADGHVAEADAKEACWEFHPSLDTPMSEASSFSSDNSFNSRQSFQSISDLSIRPVLQRQATSQSSTRGRQKPPITPISENPPQQRPTFLRNRTASAPQTEEDIFDTAPQYQSKRRMTSSFDNSAFQPPTTEPPSRNLVNPTLTSYFAARTKRRRVSSSSSGSASMDLKSEADPEDVVDIHALTEPWLYGFTPRRSREPLSPMRSSVTPRQSDFRGSQRDAAGPGYQLVGNGNGNVKGASTPFAYATPHSGVVLADEGGMWEVGGDTEVDSVGSEDETQRLETSGEVKGKEMDSWEGVPDNDIPVGDASVGAAESSAVGARGSRRRRYRVEHEDQDVDVYISEGYDDDDDDGEEDGDEGSYGGDEKMGVVDDMYEDEDMGEYEDEDYYGED
ncbi:hypothetical protein K490DRAFT_64519 [Saccharata proteae CBS 121410]|uniref:Uncharacterized protein n=1 Tax=Saccharata proteae CBS 121410 TaxID=1314787 RepID=A0A9P4M123_9PEZI|nr:hypothetical protein K490DRAFT_64519 [Saccharata proteae CBS 121410]